MHLKYFNIALALALLIGSVWLFAKTPPKGGLARVLFLSARVGVVGVWLIILSMTVLFYLSFRGLAETKDELLYERESPDKLHVVAVFNRYGGAVVHNTTKVSLRSKWEKLDTKKNQVIFDEDAGGPVEASWNGTNDLAIRTDLRYVTYQVTKCGDVTITYETK